MKKKYSIPYSIVFKFRSDSFCIGVESGPGGDASKSVTPSSNKGGINWELDDDEEEK